MRYIKFENKTFRRTKMLSIKFLFPVLIPFQRRGTTTWNNPKFLWLDHELDLLLLRCVSIIDVHLYESMKTLGGVVMSTVQPTPDIAAHY